MKIVFPNHSLGTGGGARFVCQLANALADKGHDIEIVIPEEGLIVWPLHVKITRVKALIPEAIPSADFIIPNFYTTVMPAWESKKGRVVRLSLGYEPLWVKDELALQTYQIDAPILSISQWHRQMILNGTGRDSTVIHGGVDQSIFHPLPKHSSLTGRKTIFYISRSEKYGYFWKGGNDFWEACSRLKDEHLEFDVYVVHPEPDQLVPPFPCEQRTPQNDHEMARLYAQADLYVYTSYFEAFGLPPLEAMACQTAVVTTDCGGNRDYAKHNENCLVISPSHVAQLTEGIKQLLLNDDQRQVLARNGFKDVRPWTWQRTANQVESFLLDRL
ncbi:MULTISPECIES: glycosyltransferase family 4 protein [Desulfosporosinus]|uniref:D-inositol 3-phosphate glycosyltransferase n=1 Tax=Desulfosporosinus acididurans TaxID=476652 RepID=A0A0J1FM05_9FIRM|nr:MULTISPECIES: glycosyltransferase family 4 protein [Desulfosporosinus]KLU63988.1 D-inositol 3-phosphate glycosyltransferase [Desulfosporosinus acididurans]